MNVQRDNDLELMSLRRLTDSLEATRGMLQQAQQIALSSQSILVMLANEFCGDEMLAYQMRNEDLSRIPPEELGALLRKHFKSLRLLASAGTTRRLEEADRLVAVQRTELETQRDRLSQADERIRILEGQVRILEKTLDNKHREKNEVLQSAKSTARNSEPDGQVTGEFQDWFNQWKAGNRSWERDSRLICLMGERGLSSSTELEAAFKREGQASPRTTRRILQSFVEAGLLEQETGQPLEGRPPRSYRLTGKGLWLYGQLTGTTAVAPLRETLLKAHKSERHLAVILKTAELFERLGFEVERQPTRMEIETNRFFQPDLAARKDGETYYLEVEVGEKDKPSLDHKWANALAAGGRICVVTDSLNTLRRIQGGIAQWSRFEKREVKLCITCLPELKKKLPGESPWYAIKDYTTG